MNKNENFENCICVCLFLSNACKSDFNNCGWESSMGLGLCSKCGFLHWWFLLVCLGTCMQMWWGVWGKYCDPLLMLQSPSEAYLLAGDEVMSGGVCLHLSQEATCLFTSISSYHLKDDCIHYETQFWAWKGFLDERTKAKACDVMR